jgi:hypothetical protein
MRRGRTDDTQTSIVDTLRACGVLVWPIAQPCDLLCRYRDRYYLLDCDGVTRYRKRDPQQLEKFSLWKVQVVGTPDEALKAVGVGVS